MDITLTHKNGQQETFKDAKFDDFGHHWIAFEPRSGEEKGEKITVNLKAYSVQRPTEKGPRVVNYVESITLGKNTARGDCRTCASSATLDAMTKEIERLQEEKKTPLPSPDRSTQPTVTPEALQQATGALQRMWHIIQNIQEYPFDPHATQGDDLAVLLLTVEDALQGGRS